jgi:hypothetical protein
VKISLKYPANAENAREHAGIAVKVARQDFETVLDFSPASLALLDEQIESLRDEGQTGEAAAETLFVFGCYLGEVLARELGGTWMPTPRTALAGISPWPMVLVLPGGSGWDAIGKVFRRLELGDTEYLPAYLEAARGTRDGRR